MDLDHYASLLFNAQLDLAEEYRQGCIPRTLYKYFPMGMGAADERRIDALSHNLVWLWPLSKQNDPDEASALVIDAEKMKQKGYPNRIIERCSKILQLPREDLMTASFTEVLPSKSVMWDRYANNAKGFCAEYAVENPAKLYEVLYEDGIIAVNYVFEEFIQELAKELLGKNPSPSVLARCAQWTAFQCFIKSCKWSDEKEYRILYPSPKDREGAYARIGDVGLKLRRVIAGKFCSDENTKLLESSARSLGVPFVNSSSF